MNLNELLELVRAGYTKADIEALTTPAEPAAPADPAPAEPEPAEPAKPADTAAPRTDPAKLEDAAQSNYERLEALLNKYINTQQAANINSGTIQGNTQRTTEQILAEVIAPPRKEKK